MKRPWVPPIRSWRWLGLPLAIGLASLSFAQAAAGVGLPIGWFAPLGPSFFAWQPGHQSLEERLMRPGSVSPDAKHLRDTERRILTAEPLSSAALRLTAWSDARAGRDAATLGRARMIDRITRRDPVAQLWLLEDAVRRDDVPGVLHRYDVLMRTQADLRGPLLEKLSGRLGGDQVRLALAAYADARSPWFPDLLQAAGRNGHAEEAAALLIGLPALPDTASYRSAYAAVVAALAKENGLAALRRLHPRLPGAGALGDPGLTEADLSQGYAPFRWAMAAGVERSAELEADRPGQPVLAVRAVPFSRGEAASRLVLLPGHPVALSWVLNADDQAASGGGARWAIRCLDDGRVTVSGDLLAGRHRRAPQPMPYPCTAAQLALVVDGGTGGEGTAFRLGQLRLLSAAPGRIATPSGTVPPVSAR